MFETHNHTGKRIMAMLLVFAMMLAMLGDYAPTWFTAVAEEVSEDSRGSGAEERSSDSHESSSSDGGSSDSHESSSSDGGSSDSHESSSSDGGSSDSHESSSSDGGSSDSHESSSSDGGSSDSHESSSSDGGSSDSHESSSSDSDASQGSDSESRSYEKSEFENDASDNVKDDTDADDTDADDGDTSDAAQDDTDAEDSDTSDAAQDDTDADDGDNSDAAQDDTDADDGDTSDAAQDDADADDGDNSDAAQDDTDADDGDTSDAAQDDTDADDSDTNDNARKESDNNSAVMTLTTTLSLDASGNDAASDNASEAEIDGGSVFTTQAYTTPAMLAAADGQDDDEKKVCVLQQKIDDAMSAVTGTLSGRIKVVLEKGTAYEGEVKVEKGDREVAEDFALELTTEDTGDDGLQSEGDTTFKGSMLVNGINLIIRGIGIPGKVTVEDAKLTYTGSKAADTVNVEIGSGASADMQTGEGGDTVTATVTDDGSLALDTGDGDDGVTLAHEADGEVTVDTGDGDDTVQATISKTASATIETGAGDDKVNVNDTATGKVTVDTGDDNDAVELNVGAEDGYSAGEIDINTGDGDDAVAVINRDRHSTPVSENKKGKVSVDLGTGLNDMTVSTDVAGVAPSVTINGADGNDHLHITGTLDENKDEDERITGTLDSMKLEGDNGALTLALTNIESLTDDLKNKRTVELTPGEGKNLDYTYNEAEAFTNYTIKAPSSKIKNLVIRSKDGKALPLSSLVIDTDTTWDGENKLLIKEGAVIDVQGMNLRLTARNIEVNGTIKADVVQIEALDGTGMYSRNIGDQYSAFEGTVGLPGIDEVGSGLAAGATAAWDMVNINDKATIAIGENGAVLASGDVIMLAKVEQSGDIISDLFPQLTLVPFNVVNVKVARASIDIAGKVCAGVSNINTVNDDLSNVQFDEGRGSVRVNAQIGTTIGYDKEGNMYDGWPLAVSVVYADAHVNVREGAMVEAGKDIQLGSESTLKIATRADSGMGGLPAAVAVAVVINDVRTKVDGTLNAHGGDVKVTASGDANVRSLADKNEGHESLSGGYAAISVALQDVKAELGKTAVVTAEGATQVLSTANEKVENHASSAEVDSEHEDDGILEKGRTLVFKELKKLWPKVKSALGNKFFPDSAEEKLDKAFEKVSSSDHAVKLDDEARDHGDVTTKVETTGDKTQVNVNVTPRDGYKVKSVTWRGYNAGDNQYTTGTAQKSEDGKSWTFTQSVTNVFVCVEYEEADSAEDIDIDAFLADYEESANGEGNSSTDGESLEQLIENLNAEIDEDERINRELKELEDGISFVKLNLVGKDGGVLTYETKQNDKGKTVSLDEVYTGQKVRLIPNPKEGYKLKDGGLTAKYKVAATVDGVEKYVEKTVVINPDDKGRYYLEIPEKLDETYTIVVTAAYEKGEAENESDQTQFQLTGTLAVAVADNDNQAIIDEGAQVTSRSVEVAANANTDVENVADGTAVSKETPEKKKKDDKYAIERPDTKSYKGFDVEGMKYGLLADATQNGSIKVDKADGVNRYEFTVEAEPDEGYAVGSALLIYYQDGERKIVELEKGSDGKYHFGLTNSGLNADEGSTARISFGFASTGAVTEGSRPTVSKASEPQIIISNPIQISYDALKDEDNNNISGYMGRVFYKANDNKKDDDGSVTAYAFTVTEETSYVLDGDLKATWKDASGSEQSKELTEENGVWYLEMEDIPAGTPIEVSAAFKDDFHDFKVDTKKTKNGTITLYDEKIKTGDKPKFTVKPAAGFSLGEVVVSYKDGIKDKEIKLSADKLVQAKDKDGKAVEGLYELPDELPELSDGDVTVSASFNRKSIGIYAGENDDDEDYTLSEKNVSKGDKVTVTLNADKIKAGYKVTKVTVTDASGKTVADSSEGSFVVPEKIDENARLTVKVEMGLKEIELKAAKLDGGEIKPAVARADRGEVVTVNIKPEDDLRLKSGSLKAVITDKDGNTTEVFMSRQNDTTYTFDMPSDIDKESKLSFIGEFEPGQSDSSAVETSLGAGLAVTVSNSESRADIMGTVRSAGNVKAASTITGGVKTEAKAGYSKGNTGMGGAVAVQVASMDAKSLIHKMADIMLDGKLIVDTNAKVKYTVNADASGSKEADKLGVGAGIAVAVNGSDAFAAVQDGAKLAVKTAGEKIKGIAITAMQKLEDTVSAKAGAAGGTAAVPVASVDVIAAKANAYLGKVGSDALEMEENLGISAMTDAKHAISTDASAAGKGAGVGAAIGVSVVFDKAIARLNQTAHAKATTVAAETVSNLSNDATASASGGETEGKSADDKADSMIGGAAGLAKENKSSGIDGGAIQNATKDRQKAETSEGSVGVAGAIAVNVQNSESRAEVMNGVNISASDLIAVTALNGTTAKVKANASVTNSNIGVGVGVAVNIIGLSNIAQMGDGDFEAAMLRVAATTKETTPEEDEDNADEKPKDKDGMVSQMGEAVSEYITELAKEIGLDEYVPAEMLTGIVDPIIEEITQSLLDASGLGELFGDGDIGAKYDAMIAALEETGTALTELPGQLIAPIMEIVKDSMDLGALTGEQIEALEKALLKEFTARLKDELLDYKKLGKSAADTLKGAAFKWVKKELPGILKGMFKGNNKQDNWKKFGKGLFKYLSNALLLEVKRVTETSLEAALQNVEVPGVTLLNRSRAVKAFKEVKDAWKAKSLNNIYEDAADYVTETFRNQVFDYEKMFNSLAEIDFKEEISKALREGATNAMVALTNGAVSKLTSTLGVTLEAEQAEATGHVIETQAIAGAGAKDVGVAGSVAVTVLNANTIATIADGKADRKVNVTGEMTVEADELRSVKNVASAAADANGDAEDNKSSEDSDNKNVGGNEAKSVAENDKKTTKLTVDVGGKASIREGDKGDNRPKFYITLKDGYKLPDGNKASYTYKKKDGSEVKGTVTLLKDGDGWTLDAATDSELKKAPADAVIELELKPVEVLHKVAKPDTSLSDVKLDDDAVTLSVKGRDPEDDKTIKARVGEVVEIHVARKPGQVLNGIAYAYTDKDGKVHEVELNPKDGSSTGKEKAFTLVTKSEKEYVYTITMPDGDVSDILVSIVKGEEADDGDSNTAAKSDDGKKVGVGAAFSMVYGDTHVTATAGQASYAVGALDVKANTEHKENISSAAGTDPLSGDLDTDDTKDISVDATVALNILDNDILAKVSENASVRTTEGDLNVSASEDSNTETTASAFSVGEATAVGASVALNIANSGVKASMLGGAEVAGNAAVTSNTHSEDVTKAMATAMGADIARTLAKVGEKVNDDLQEKANKMLAGEYVKTAGKDNKTGDKINKRLDEKSNGDKKSVAGDATSKNALKTQDVKSGDGGNAKSGVSEATGEANGITDKNLGDADGGNDQNVMVAAAVGLTIASHDASTEIGRIVAGKKIDATAENTGNFNTMGTGAAMSLAKNANAIALGVAVSVNSNTASVKANGDIVSNDGEDVNVTSTLTQNMDGDFAGKLAAQSLAGSVAGKGSKASLAGAVSVVVGKASSKVSVASGTDAAKRRIEGGNITIEATDKSKLAARAGGLSLSTGASVGMGVASTTIVSSNTVEAGLGDNTAVKAGGAFKLNAEKKEVNFDDYKNLVDMRYLVTDSSNLTDEQRENANTGLIDLKKGADDKNYTAEVNLTSDKLLDLADGLNFLSSQNTYAEAIAGAVSTGKGNAALSGSFAVAVANNHVTASLGDKVTIEMADGADVTAKDGNNARIIAGSLSAAPAKASVGATVAVMVNSDQVRTESGDNVEIKSTDAAKEADISHTAEVTGKQQVFTGAMSVAAGKETGTAVGGAINVIVSNTEARNLVGKDARFNATRDVNYTSKATYDLMAISGSAAVTAGSGVAAGGTVNVIVDNTVAQTKSDLGLNISAGRNATVASDISDQLISGTASASAAASVNGKSGAGVVNVIISKSNAETYVAGGANLNANGGDLKLTANNDAMMLNASLAAAGASSMAVGAAVNVNVFKRFANVYLGEGSKGTASGDVNVQASGRNTDIIGALSVAGSVAGSAISGNVGAAVESSQIRARIGDNTALTAGRNALIESYFSDYTVDAAGNIAISGTSPAVGATIVTLVKNNEVATELNVSTITANRNNTSATKAQSGADVNGVYVGANAKETMFIGAAGIAASGAGVAANGEVVTVVNNNKVTADASKAILKANGSDGAIGVIANDDTRQMVLAGGVNVSRTNAAGAAVVSLISGKEIQARAHDLEAATDVDVIASNDDKYTMLNVNAGVSGGNTAALGVSIASFESKVNAEVASSVIAKNGSFNLKANNKSDITGVAVALAVGARSAATPVFVYTGYSGETNAKLKAGVVQAKNAATIAADSNKTVNQYTVGMSASGEAALSGAVSIMKVGDTTNAIVDASTSTTAAKMNVTADSDYKLTGASGTIAAGGEDGMAVNGMLTIVKASTLAEMGGKATLNGSEGMNVKASSKRDIIKAAISAGVGGEAGVSVGVMGLIAGDKMDQEAADQLIYGNATNKNKKLFDVTALQDVLKQQNIETGAMADLSKDLEGNGQTTDTSKLGHSEGSGTTFDVASGYSDGTDGENSQASETEDVKRAKLVGSTAYSDSPKDAVIARVSESADITGATTVEAEQETLADLYGASVGVGGTVGGGISIAIAKLRSNVFAESLGDIKANDGKVIVKAVSKSGESVADNDEKARSNALKKSLGNKIDPTKRSIRAIGLAAGGGTTGAAVAAGFVRLDNITEATLAGHVEKAGGIDVAANADYDNVLAATIAAAVGSTWGIAGSLAIAVSDGTVKATMGKNKTTANAIEQDGEFETNSKDASSAINVTTDSNFGANAITVSAAGGLVGGAGGVAIATNNLTQDTTVERGAKLTNLGKPAALNVNATSTSAANGYLMGLSAGAGAVGIGVSVVKVKPTLNTTVGVVGANTGTTAIDGFADVNVANDVNSQAESNLLSAAVGGVSVGVNVMTVYNDTDAAAKAANLQGSVNNLNVSGKLGAKGVSNVAAVSVGGVGIGVAVNYVDVNSKNLAEADLTNGDLTINDKLSVTTGDASYSHQTSANTNSLSAAAGLGVVAVNTSVARNRAINEAVIRGNTLAASSVDLMSYSKGSATAKLTGASVGGINIVTSVVNALNETTSNAKMALNGALNGNLTARSDVQGDTNANLITGTGSLLGDVTTNVATANGRTAALADIAIGGTAGRKQSIDSQVTGKDTVKTTIENLIGLSLGLSVATMVGGAHSHDVYDNKVKLSNGEYDLSKINVTTDYATTADSNVTPSSAGVRINSASVAVNRSSATSDAYAGAMLTLDHASAGVDGDLNIKTTGQSTVTGLVKPAAFEFSTSVNIGSNKSRAESKGTQAATLKLIAGKLTRANTVDVQSIVKAANAKAVVSANGMSEKNKKSVKISGTVKDANTANTAQNIASTAAILGEGTDDNTIDAASLNVKATNDKAITAEGRTDGAFSVGFVTAGSMEGTASTGAVYNVVLNGVKAKITGDAALVSSASATADVVGAMPGSLSAAGGLHSDIKAGVGTQANRQTSKVLIGENAALEAGGTLQVHALNDGNATASFRQGTSISLTKSADSSQPTDSWYDTGVIVGNGANLKGGGNSKMTVKSIFGTMTIPVKALDILSQTTSNSVSEVEAESVGLLINSNKMKGEVFVHSDNNVSFGENVKVAAKGDINIRTAEGTKALAHTDLSGGGLFDGTYAKAEATVARYAKITVGKGSSVTSEKESVLIQSHSGDGSDDIQVIAYVSAGGAISIAKARTDATVTTSNEVHLLEGVNITARKDIDVYATADTHGGEKKDGSGIYIYPKAKSSGVGVAPEAKAVMTLNFTSYVNVNRGGSGRVKLTSKDGNINVRANNEGLRVYSDPGANGKAAGGKSEAKTDVIANLSNLIWIDAADFNARNQTNILADNGVSTKGKILVDTAAELLSGGGTVRAENWIKGSLNNQIRTNNKNNVTFVASKTTHKASINIDTDVDYHRERLFFTTSKKGGNNWEWSQYWRCDFCGKSGGANLGNIRTQGAQNAAVTLKSALEKALSPLTDIQKMVEDVQTITRARYGEEDYAAASKIFVLQLLTRLGEDVKLTGDQISKYRLWQNKANYLEVYMLPNATRLFSLERNGKSMLKYVVEVLRGDMRGDGEIRDIDIITALTDNAMQSPVIPVGSSGLLDFSTGTLRLPPQSDFELYLHEISESWMIEAWNDGFFQTLIADQDEINNCVLHDGDLPSGKIKSTLIDGGEADGWHIWWIGDSPDTAADPDETLVCLLTNSETDEVNALRTTVNMTKNGEEPVDVSLYLYRDGKADRHDTEKYNIMFFDTPAGEKSLVKVITDLLMGRVLVTLFPMHIVLRAFAIEGADLPVYSISDHFFAMCDGTDGKVGMFDGDYKNTFDGKTFESDFIVIEGIVDNDLNVTIKKEQPIWAEPIDDNIAGNIQGDRFVRAGEEWYSREEAPKDVRLPYGAVAA